MCGSRFSLCPRGHGPHSLSLWLLQPLWREHKAPFVSSTKNSLAIPFEDLDLGKPVRSAKTTQM